MAIRLIVQGPSAESPGRAHSLLFDQPRIHIGRSASADLCLPHASVSALHASIRLEGTSYVLVDEDSTNGTRVDTQLLPPHRPKRLSDGALIHVGAFAIRVELVRALPEPPDPKRCGIVARALLADLLEADGEGLEPASLEILGSVECFRLMDHPLPLVLTVRKEDGIDRFALSDEPAMERGFGEPGAEAESIARIQEDGGSYSVEALRNGLALDGQAFRRRRLRSGSVLAFGDARAIFHDPIEEALEARLALPDEVGDFELPASDGVEGEVRDRVRREVAHEGRAVENDSAEDAGQISEALPANVTRAGNELEVLRPSAADASSARWAPRQVNELPPQGAQGSDALVYMLAGAMIALSALGLYLLFGSM